jgi:Domain of unknown function (DUF4034)
MLRRNCYAWALLAVFTALTAGRSWAQESLGDIARRLRTGKPDSSTPAKPGERPAAVVSVNNDLNATMTILAEQDETAYATRLRTQLEQERFKVLDDVAAAERAGKTRFAGGDWRLHVFYSAIETPKEAIPSTEAGWADLLDQMKRWASQQPDSITAQVSMAYAYLNYARQTPSAQGDSATAEGRRVFEERLKLAETVLNQSYQLPTKCPEWYDVMLQVGRTKGWDMEDLSALFQRAVAFEPDFYYYYQEQALNLTPKWRGKDGDVEKFADESGNKVGGKPGNILYWEITQFILGDRELNNPAQQFSWSRAQLGYQALTEQFGSSMLRKNQQAQIAARFGDYMVTDETIAQIGDHWDRSIWGTREYFDKVKTWASSSAVPFRKTIEAYKAVSLNVATPEGQKYDELIAREFSGRYSRAVKECAANATGPSPTLLILQMGKSGAIQQMMVVPDNASDSCLRPKLEKAAFTPPPKPEYWVRVSLGPKP